MRSVSRLFLRAPLVLLAAALVFPVLAHAEDIAVPDVVGKDEVEAARLLSAAGFIVERLGTTVPTRKPEAESTVQGQLPSAGQKRPYGAKVQIFIYGPISVKVPAVEGLPRDIAEAAIRAAGLEPVLDLTAEAPPTRAGEQTVKTQSPAAGATANRTSNVVIVIYGAFENGIPDVRKLSYDTAVEVLEKAGLRVGGVERGGAPAPSEELAERVSSQSPAQGSRIPREPDRRVVHLVLYGPSPKQPTKPEEPKGPGGPGGLLGGLSTVVFEGVARAEDGTEQKVTVRVTYQPDGSALVHEQTSGARWKVPAGDRLRGKRGTSVHFPNTVEFDLDVGISGDAMTGTISADDPTLTMLTRIRWEVTLKRRD
jgi:beta-lactam-binding protein with PASTA domain